MYLFAAFLGRRVKAENTEENVVSGFVLDRKLILERLGGDEEIYSVMVDMFVGDIDNNCRALTAALAAGDAVTLCREAHTVKGLLATFSDDVGAAMALHLEQRAHDGLLSGLEPEIEAVQRRLHEVAAVLQET